MQRAGPHFISKMAWWCILGGRGAQSLQPVEQEDEDSHYWDGSSNAGPYCQVEGGEQGEDVDLLLRLSQKDANAVVKVTLAEVDHVFPLWCDGDG